MLHWKVEEPWTTERVAKFIDLLGYRETTLRSDTEPTIIATRKRVTEMCTTKVATEDAVKGDKQSNGVMENTVMLICGIIRTITCHLERGTQEELTDDSPSQPRLVEKRERHLRGCMTRESQELVPLGEKMLAKPFSEDPVNKMNLPTTNSEFGLE